MVSATMRELHDLSQETLPPTEAQVNSDDKYSHVGQDFTEEQWRDKDLQFKRVMRRYDIA